MQARAFVVDTNVVVAGLLTGDPFRPRICSRHGLDADEIDSLLTELVANAIIREPDPSNEEAPSRQDQHLWDLLGTEHGTVLITGDQSLLDSPPRGASVISPARFSS